MSQDWDGGLTGGMGGPIAQDFQFKKSSQEPQDYTVHPLFLKAPEVTFPSSTDEQTNVLFLILHWSWVLSILLGKLGLY